MATTEAFRNSRKAQMIAVMLESLFVGVFAALIIFVSWILWNNYDTMPRTRKILFGSTVVMFILSAMHLGLVMQEVTVDNVPLTSVRLQIILSMFQYVIGDLVLIWRVWVMWKRSYMIAAGPLILMLTAAGFTLHLAAQQSSNAFFTVVPVALIVANTTLCTLLIAGQIWYLHRKLDRASTGVGGTPMPSHYKGIIMLMVESGALYTACQIVSLVLHYTQSVGLPIVLDLEIPLIGILPTLIIVFVHFGMVPGAQKSNPIASITFQRTRTSHVTMDVMSLPNPTSRYISSGGFESKGEILPPLEYPEPVVKFLGQSHIF
ncbi:hypothetical protein BDZ94DRAFT_1310850 [Collybia nuda]|uniref:Uncharacterized protein n=1 Tax=Collybia nuda TaxID=64659 RepID=A0A9P6CHN6_9AGAR|nr:hypothetical protein BDZ94DRAFT_1310850 [Collybia nuda]